jgi:hypothetical protein
MPDGAVQREEVVPSGPGPGLGLLGPTTRHLLELEFGSRAQFDDDRHGPAPLSVQASDKAEARQD